MKTECPFCGVILFLVGRKIGWDHVASVCCRHCGKKFCIVENVALKFTSIMLRTNNPSSRRFSQQ